MVSGDNRTGSSGSAMDFKARTERGKSIALDIPYPLSAGQSRVDQSRMCASAAVLSLQGT